MPRLMRKYNLAALLRNILPIENNLAGSRSRCLNGQSRKIKFLICHA